MVPAQLAGTQAARIADRTSDLTDPSMRKVLQCATKAQMFSMLTRISSLHIWNSGSPGIQARSQSVRRVNTDAGEAAIPLTASRCPQPTSSLELLQFRFGVNHSLGRAAIPKRASCGES